MTLDDSCLFKALILEENSTDSTFHKLQVQGGPEAEAAFLEKCGVPNDMAVYFQSETSQPKPKPGRLV